MGIFVNIDKNKSLENFKKFITKLSNLSDFHVEPFQNIYELILTKKLDKDIEQEVNVFKDLLDILANSREKKRERTMSVKIKSLNFFLFNKNQKQTYFYIRLKNGKRLLKTKIFVSFAMQILRIWL